MKKLLLLPVMFFPYAIALALYCIFSGFLMETVFSNSAFHLLFALGVFYLAALVCTLVALALSGREDGVKLARWNLAIKLVPVPAYLMIFLIGAMCLFTIFTFGISALLLLLDVLAIVLSGIVQAVTAALLWHQRRLSLSAAVVHGILGFFFCVDLVSAIVLAVSCKNREPD